MSQDDIFKLMRKCPKMWFSVNDLNKNLCINRQSISKNVSSIIKFKNIYGVRVKTSKRNERFIRFI